MTNTPRLTDFPPYLLQAAPADPDALWETFGVFETREQARALRDELDASFLTSGVDLDDEGSSSPTITRLVSLLEVLQEGSDALYGAISDLVMSADEHEAMEAVMLGGLASVSGERVL